MDKVAPPLAVTAAALFLAACGGSSAPAADSSGISPAAASAQTVRCQGIHECKGQSQCGVPNGHACAGQNDCKGKGWVQVSQVDCAAKGGVVL